MTTSNTDQCANCRGFLSPYWQHCQHCGAPLEVARPPGTPAPVVDPRGSASFDGYIRMSIAASIVIGVILALAWAAGRFL